MIIHVSPTKNVDNKSSNRHEHAKGQWNVTMLNTQTTLPTPDPSEVSDDEEEGNCEVVPLHQSSLLINDDEGHHPVHLWDYHAPPLMPST
jgi:hypothetical protein